MTLQPDKVILVNEKDEWTGIGDKLETHHKGLLHRALSIVILNENGEMLLQQRADGKYHSGGLWTNACCSHPAPGESTCAAAHRRLKEELGFDTELTHMATLRYTADVGNDLTENEFDHIYTGSYGGPVMPHKEEVKDFRFMETGMIREWLTREPAAFSPWFRLVFDKWREVNDQAILQAGGKENSMA